MLRPRQAHLTVSLDEEQEGVLEANTFAHLDGAVASHCLVRGPAGRGTSALVWDPIVMAAKKGLRVVQVSTTQSMECNLNSIRFFLQVPRPAILRSMYQLSATGRQVSHQSLSNLCRSLARHHRLRFVVILENVQVQPVYLFLIQRFYRSRLC